MKRARNLILTAMFATAVLFVGQAAVPPTAAASIVCHGSYFYLVLYQDAYYGGDCLGIKDADVGGNGYVANLGTISGPCRHLADNTPDWNDCVSSYKWSINSCHWHYSIYGGANYTNLMYSGDGGANFNRATMPAGYNDTASSRERLLHVGVCALASALGLALSPARRPAPAAEDHEPQPDENDQAADDRQRGGGGHYPADPLTHVCRVRRTAGAKRPPDFMPACSRPWRR